MFKWRTLAHKEVRFYHRKLSDKCATKQKKILSCPTEIRYLMMIPRFKLIDVYVFLKEGKRVPRSSTRKSQSLWEYIMQDGNYWLHLSAYGNKPQFYKRGICLSLNSEMAHHGTSFAEATFLWPFGTSFSLLVIGMIMNRRVLLYACSSWLQKI